MPRAGRKGKSKDNRPARSRYWMMRRLETKKVKNLVEHCGLDYGVAFHRWHKERQGRVPKSYLRYGAT